MTVYLDYNATTPVLPEVKETMLAAMEYPSNPSSVHYYGRKAKAGIEKARKTIAASVSGADGELVFTGCGTEANHLALNGLPELLPVISAIEHSSVRKAVSGALTIPVDANGVVDLTALDQMLARVGAKMLVSVMLANNETGVIQPIAEVAEIAYRHGGYVHCDAAQAVGKIEVDMARLNVDMLTISAHKFGGPQGVAALLVKKGISLKPMLRGGGQERNMRAGTENVAAIMGFAKAAELESAQRGEALRIRTLRDRMEKELKEVAGVTVFGEKAERLPNTSSITMPGVKNETQVIAFDMAKFAVSAGSACSSGRIEPSHVLKAMGVSDKPASEAIRISLGVETTEEEITAFIAAWKKIYNRGNFAGTLEKAA